LLAIYHLIKFAPYTRFGKKDIPNRKREEVGDTISLLVSNVLIENRDFDRLAKLVNEVRPDVLVVLETDKEWLDQLVAQIDTDLYPNKVLQPQEDGYGLGFFTKRVIVDREMEHVSDVPSLMVRIEDQSGGEILLFVVHPRPPVPGEAETTWPKDRELLYVANAVKEAPLDRAIVLGDMNEVAWSKTSQRFLQISGLKDPRRGRHILPTFPSYFPLLSFPLDHVFCSGHFGVLQYKRLKSIGSDHFPLFIELGYNIADDRRSAGEES